MTRCNGGYAFERETVISPRSGPLGRSRTHLARLIRQLANSPLVFQRSASFASCPLFLCTLILSSLFPSTIIVASDKPCSPLDQERDDLDDYYRASWLPSFPFIQQRSLLFRLDLYHHPRPTNPRARVSSLMDLFIPRSLSRAQARPKYLLFSLPFLTVSLYY